MNQADFTTDLTVEQTPIDVYNAIIDVWSWWSEDVEGTTDTTGGEFIFRGHDIHRSQIRVTELIPGERVAWLVVENYMNFVADQSEWKGSQIIFDLSPAANGGTDLHFRHLGLVPAYECFDACSSAWGFFINASLRSLITTGVGQPMEPAINRHVSGARSSKK